MLYALSRVGEIDPISERVAAKVSVITWFSQTKVKTEEDGVMHTEMAGGCSA